MGFYDEALVKSLETGDSWDLGLLLDGDLIKAHVKAHFRLNPKTGKREFVKDYHLNRHKHIVDAAFEKGDKVKIDNPKSKHHGKVMEVLSYSKKYDVVRGKIDGQLVDFHADKINTHEDGSKPDAPKASVGGYTRSDGRKPADPSFTKGDKVTIANPKKYDSLAPASPVEGEVQFFDKNSGTYNVKVGSGSYNVPADELKTSKAVEDKKPAITDFSKMSDQQLFDYSQTLLKISVDVHNKGDDHSKKEITKLTAKVFNEMNRRKQKDAGAEKPAAGKGKIQGGTEVKDYGSWKAQAEKQGFKVVEKLTDYQGNPGNLSVAKDKDGNRVGEFIGEVKTADPKPAADAPKRIEDVIKENMKLTDRGGKGPVRVVTSRKGASMGISVALDGLDGKVAHRLHGTLGKTGFTVIQSQGVAQVDAKKLTEAEAAALMGKIFGEAKGAGAGKSDPAKLKAELEKLQESVKNPDIRPGTENYVLDRIAAIKKMLGEGESPKPAEKGKMPLFDKAKFTGKEQAQPGANWDEQFPYIKEFMEQAGNTQELGRLKKQAYKWMMENNDWKAGPIDHFHKQHAEKLRSLGLSGHKPTSAADARMDRLLRTRDSSGKATPRKFR